ncbi:MAG: transferrin receptor-like dimerization domain-containing protein [Candidatus Acidiferrales bacterium]
MSSVRTSHPATLLLLALMAAMAATLVGQTPTAGEQAAAGRISGFTPAKAERQLLLEEELKTSVSPEKLREFHRELTSEPHPAGSERNNQLAEWIAGVWRAQGWEDVRIHRYDVLVSSPREVVVEMVAPVAYKAGLREDAYEADPDSANPRVDGAYLGLSASGEVTAPVIYAHSGNPEDYDLLRKRGIDVRGKIVLVRYSVPYSYRGFKALTAQERGAAAILIYSDPAEDGYKKGEVFPDGPWGPESHIQRGAITYDFMAAGDPLTPGWASVPGAKTIPAEESVSLPKIIAVPLSWRDAKPLLENLDGPMAPKQWQGGLPLAYRLGGERVRVRVKVEMNTRLAPNYVVEARLRGAELPDEWIVMGSHRDAWVYGAVDAASGNAAMLELTRTLGELRKKDWRPRRTLVVCSWDGEEVALTASTEWGEQFAEELKEKAVAYINVDPGVSGPEFAPGGSPSLAPLLVEASRSLAHPAGRSLYAEWKQARESQAGKRKRKARVRDTELVNTRVGSGSDHTVFLNFLGIPVLLPDFEGPYGVYHSLYDSFYWMNQFGDPGYRVHALLTQLWGVVALRLANAEALPYDFALYGENVKSFIEELEHRRGLRGRVNLRPAKRSAEEFAAAGRALQEALEKKLAGGELTSDQANRLNRRLMQVERNWLHPEGIPGRPWFKHLIYGTRYTYAHLELPGLTGALERKDWRGAAAQVRLLELALLKNRELLRAALAELGE